MTLLKILYWIVKNRICIVCRASCTGSNETFRVLVAFSGTPPSSRLVTMGWRRFERVFLGSVSFRPSILLPRGAVCGGAVYENIEIEKTDFENLILIFCAEDDAESNCKLIFRIPCRFLYLEMYLLYLTSPKCSLY